QRLAALGDILDELRPTACCGTLRVGIALRRAELTPAPGLSAQLLDWLGEHGGLDGSGVAAPSADLGEVDFLLRYRRDTRDRPVFPTAGVEHELDFTAALPGSDIEYSLADYRVSAYRPLGRR